MSDSDALSTPANFPEDTEIEFAIHQVVRAGFKEDDFSIRVARSRVEKELDLPTDFFKNDAAWKTRSKELIETAAQEFAEEDNDDAEEEKKIEVEAKPKPKAKSTAGTKRKSDDAPKAKQKRRKKSPSVKSDESEAELSAAESEKASPPPKPKPKSQAKSEDTSALSTPPEQELEPEALKQNGKQTIPASNDDDESDLSSVIDDPPPKKKRGPKTTKSSSPSATTKSKPKAQKPAKPDLSPDEEEIKRLQSWLLKCGIRKLWHRELAAYPTAKEKIKHLKGMLEDVGMTGRFSAEKARQIKESRELAAELEAAREFNEQWGHEDEDDSDENGAKERKKAKVEKMEVEVEEPPAKRRPRGLVDFGDSGEESD